MHQPRCSAYAGTRERDTTITGISAVAGSALIFQHLEAVEFRHEDIQQDQVESRLHQSCESFRAAAHHRDLMSLAREMPRQKAAAGFVIVDDQD
jgi:hypothetical protein